MLAIDIIKDFRELLNESPEEFTLSKQNLLKIMLSYEEELGSDTFGKEGNSARIHHYYNGLREYKRQVHETNIEIYKAANQIGQSAIKSVFLMNGGAAIAISAFIGTIASTPNAEISASSLALPLGLFAFGTFSASISHGAAYITQFAQGYPDDKGVWKSKLATGFNWVAIASGIIGLTLFGLGLLETYHTMAP